MTHIVDAIHDRTCKARPVKAGLSVLIRSALLVSLGVGSASGASSSSFFLDSYNANNASGGNSVTGPSALVAGQTYTVKVQGTFSAWAAWPRRCGEPRGSAVYASPPSDRQPVTPVGDDAVFRFAHPLFIGKCSHHRPFPTGYFQVNLGNGWKPFVPDGGVPRGPSRDTHPYTATIIGQGVKPRFRIVDHHTSDNNGQLRITISS